MVNFIPKPAISVKERREEKGAGGKELGREERRAGWKGGENEGRKELRILCQKAKRHSSISELKNQKRMNGN